jgi:hypothetical protein
MAFNKPIIQTSNPNKQENAGIVRNRTIFYGEVISIDDQTDGGRIKVRIPELDNRTSDADLPWSYPLMPKFFHIYPQVTEMVRVFLEDTKFPERSRFWLGSIISQPQKIGYDANFGALSTTNLGLIKPDKAPSTFPDAEGVYPLKTDVAIVGKVNTDVILRLNEVHIRAGKHEAGDVLKLNTQNPASLDMVFEPVNGNDDEYRSSSILMSDKIALISHEGNPRFKAARVTPEDRERIFEQGHPIARGDVTVEALRVIIDAIITHIHPYSGMPVDKTAVIKKLEELQLELILQKNIVIN